MNGTYRTVFEVSHFGNAHLDFLGIGVVALIIGLILPWFSKRKNLKSDHVQFKRLALVYVVGPLLILIGVIVFYSNVINERKLTSALANNQCDIVEGVVQVLHQEPVNGHDVGDHIKIGNKEFIYSYWTLTVTFNRTISHGGELKNGAVARLHYIGNDILKVEIKQ
jgi:hypothetical protein